MARHQRDPKLEQFWRRHLQRQHSGAFTIRAYCRLYDLHESAFYAWRRIIALRDAQTPTRVRPVTTPTATTPSPTTVPAFVPVAVVDSVNDRNETPIDIRLTQGHRLRIRSGCDRGLLADVLTLLQQSASESRP